MTPPRPTDPNRGHRAVAMVAAGRAAPDAVTDVHVLCRNLFKQYLKLGYCRALHKALGREHV